MEETLQDKPAQDINLKFCKHCGGKIPQDAVLCTLCGRQVEQLAGSQNNAPNVTINNANSNINTNTSPSNHNMAKSKNKWVALLLCFFFGVLGVHKFYEGKILLGILYIFTMGLFGIGVFIDFIILLFKPNPYSV